MIAPTRASCETIELALTAQISTLLERQHGNLLREWATQGKAFGIVAGTGTGKTLGIRIIAQAILQSPLVIGVVNREREATPETALCNVVIVTTGIARRWLTDNLVSRRDTIIVDEIHQTSAELELCLALGKRIGSRFIWLSATVDPGFYREYLGADEVLETSAFDPALRAKVEVLPKKPEEFLDERTVRRLIRERRGVAVFLPTRAEVERLGEAMKSRFPRLEAAFYHGGEPIRVIRPFLEGEIKKPYLLAMTAAGQSALNLPGLDTVVIYDARYGNVVDRGRNVLHRLYLGANEILQMAGRVHGRVKGGEVTILSDRELDFNSLVPVPPEFQLAGDAERVALTCAAIGVDATDLDLPVPLDRQAYRKALALLTQRGLIANGRLTDWGRKVETLPVERGWAELILQADAELLPVVAVAAGIESLHRMTREERELHGVAVPGSDHLTAYQLFAEAVNQFGIRGELHGLSRYVFEDENFERWSEQRGVLMKAVEDAALAMASVYRALGLQLPATLPRITRELKQAWVDLLARVQPFALVIDEQTTNGEEVRTSRTSLAGNWGAISGNLRYFADRHGIPRASIEGTTIPTELVRHYATWGPEKLILLGHRKRQSLALASTLSYFGFDLEQRHRSLNDKIPSSWLESVRHLLATSLRDGVIFHPDASLIQRTFQTARYYWNRSGGVIRSLEADSLLELLRAQLDDIGSWEEFQQIRVSLDLDHLLNAAERRRLDALPDSIRVFGDQVPLEYEMSGNQPTARLWLRSGQLRRLRSTDLPQLDRPLTFGIRQGDHLLQANSLLELKALLDSRPATRKPRTPRNTTQPPRGRGRHQRRRRR